MDSDSDWDSLTADGPDIIAAPSVAEKSQSRKADLSPRPPNYDKVVNAGNKKQTESLGMSPVNKSSHVQAAMVAKTSNSVQNSPAKKGSFLPDHYRSTRAQGVTVFKDHGDDADENDRSMKGKSNLNNNFDEVVLQDKSEYETKKGSQRKTGKLQGNLPYTNFEVKEDYNQNIIPQQAIKNSHPIKAEYIRNTPEPPYGSPRQKNTHDEADARLMANIREPTPTNASKQATIPMSHELAVTRDTHFYQSAPKSNANRRNMRKSPELGHTNRGMDFIVKEESDTDQDVTWNNDASSMKIDIKDNKGYLLQEKNTTNNERIYYQKSNNYYYTLPHHSDAVLPKTAEKLQTYIRRGWQEVFGALQILLDFIIIFLVEFSKFVFKQFAKKLLAGFIEGFSDYVIKPLLAVLYNGVFQPSFTFMWNLLNGFRNLLQPFLVVSRELAGQLALILGSIRLVEINSKTKRSSALEGV